MVDGAGIHCPMATSERPERKASASSMLSPPARAEAITPIALEPHAGVPGRVAQVDTGVNQLAQAELLGEGHGQQQPPAGDGLVIVEDDCHAVQGVR